MKMLSCTADTLLTAAAEGICWQAMRTSMAFGDMRKSLSGSSHSRQ